MKRIALGCVLALLSSASFAEPPASSGIVTRGSYEAAWWLVDETTGMGLVVGVDIVSFCSGAGEFGFIGYSDKDIQEGLRLVTLEKSNDLVASVWPFMEFDCDLFLTELPLAAGEVRRRMHDNDLFGLRFCEIKNNMNAWGTSIHGALYSPSGDKRQLSANFWGLFDCDTLTFPVNKTKIVLTN